MKGFTLCLPFFFFLPHCNHSNRTRINLLLSETTQESPLDLIICFAPFLHFLSAKLQQKWSERQIGEKEKWIACLIPGFSKCNVNGNGDDYHLACNQEAWLIFCSAEMEKDVHIISQNRNITVGARWQVFQLCCDAPHIIWVTDTHELPWCNESDAHERLDFSLECKLSAELKYQHC